MKPLKDDLTEMNMDQIAGRKPMLDGLTENLDGAAIGFNRKDGKPFASGHFLDTVCSDALSFWKRPIADWMEEQTDIYLQKR